MPDFLSTLGQASVTAHSSASQFKTFALCMRWWWFEKVAMIKKRQKGHLILGKALHAISERYTTKQATTWEGLFFLGWDKGLAEHEAAWVRAMAVHAVEKGLWQANPLLQIEKPLALLVGREFLDERGMPLTAAPVVGVRSDGEREIVALKKPLPMGWNRLPPFVGFSDVWGETFPIPEIHDHKTSKNRTWATTVGKLADDIQMFAYAAAMLSRRKDATTVVLQHNVFLKDRDTADAAYPVKVVGDLATVAQRWAKLIQDSEDMKLLREVAPLVEGDPDRRADNFHKVRSAIDQACAQGSCNAYGGCPYKDACYGRDTVQRMVARLDSPDISLIPHALPINNRPAGSTFSLNISRKEPSMAFTKPPPKPTGMGPLSDVFIMDPSDPKVCYRTRILTMTDAEAYVALWPDAAVEPDWQSLPEDYRMNDIAKETLLPAQPAGVALWGYHKALLAAGYDAAAVAWQPRPSPVSSAPAPAPGAAVGVEEAKVTEKKSDGQFSLNIPTKPAPATTPPPHAAPSVVNSVLAATSASTPKPGTWGAGVPADKSAALAAQIDRAKASLPPPSTFEPEVGMRVVVKVTDHKLLSPFSGKIGEVLLVEPGDKGHLLTVKFPDGAVVEDMACGRFEQAPVVVAEEDPSQSPASSPSWQAFAGKFCHIIRKSQGSPMNFGVSEVLPEGLFIGSMTTNGVKFIIPYEDIAHISILNEQTDIPGREPTKEEKAAAKAAAKAEKEAGEAAAAALCAPKPHECLARALETLKAALNGGKVTRKVPEGIEPLLQEALTYQAVIEANTANGAPIILAGSVAPPVDHQLRGVISVALDHAISTLTEARSKIK